ncbi:hypothetical protein Shyhy01_65080 [Streptomyces hygroscopicus subsp. hygroscopicus]|nr:hypothetical protein Shyhy01_65080 [Streptomyces hygroscopicus subsp. hygroscopicus]
MVRACLNGGRTAGHGPAVPRSPRDLGRSTAETVAAGTREIHVHPKCPCGRDSLSPRVLGPTLEALRAEVPVPIGVTTGAWADPAARLAHVRSWSLPPGFASVDWHEPGAAEPAAPLRERGVRVEAGIRS